MIVTTKTGKINATKDVLCEIATLYYSEAKRVKESGHELASKYYYDVADAIYDALDAKHYYDDVRI